MKKRNLYFQKNIFHEDDDEHIKVIEKYFDIMVIDNNWSFKTEKFYDQFRTSIAYAKQISRFEKFTSALEWAGKLRKEMVSSDFYFQNLDHAVCEFEKTPDCFKLLKLFVRPISGDKTFAGNVFTIKTLRNELDFLIQKNVDPSILCLIAPPIHIKNEYRLIFIDGQYISGSRYMVDFELSVDGSIPYDIVEYGKLIHQKYDLPPWVVLDVGVTHNGPKVIELNQLETSSYYGADLDKIYKAWSNYYEKE